MSVSTVLVLSVSRCGFWASIEVTKARLEGMCRRPGQECPHLLPVDGRMLGQMLRSCLAPSTISTWHLRHTSDASDV